MYAAAYCKRLTQSAHCFLTKRTGSALTEWQKEASETLTHSFAVDVLSIERSSFEIRDESWIRGSQVDIRASVCNDNAVHSCFLEGFH